MIPLPHFIEWKTIKDPPTIFHDGGYKCKLTKNVEANYTPPPPGRLYELFSSLIYPPHPPTVHSDIEVGGGRMR